MAQILNKPTDVNVGSNVKIQIPENTQPTAILSRAEIPILPYSGTTGDTSYKVKANSTDPIPGYLAAKIGSNFAITDNKIELVNFDDFTSDDLTQGSTNLFLTQSAFDSLFGAKSTSDLTEGTNLYYTEDRVIANTDVAANTLVRHTHSNKTTLDLITSAFTTDLKSTYDGYSSGIVSSATDPITFIGNVIAHSTELGNKHVPSDSGIPSGYILSKGASDGVYSWIENTVNQITLDSTPTTSTESGVQSAWIKNHNENNNGDSVNHVTDTNLTYINSTIPNHISNALIHVPSYETTDADKYLRINSTGNGFVWDDSDSGLSLSGQSYLTLIDNELTANKINISQTNIASGNNITIVDNVISATQRDIDTSPSTSITKSISSSWANNHYVNYGNKGHIPALGSSGSFLAWDGSFKDISNYVNEIDVLDYVLGMQEDSTLDPGISPTTGDRYIILDSTDLNTNFGVITGIGDNDIVEYNGASFDVSFDSSAALASIEVTVTTDSNDNIDRQWYYSKTGSEWRDRGIVASTYWSKDSNNLSPIDVLDSLLLPIDSKLAWDTGVSYITATNTNIISIFTGGSERLQINDTTIDAKLPISIDTINELSSGVGVTIEGALIKDNEVTTNLLNIYDNTYFISKDASNNLTFTDPVSGTVTLATLLASAAVTSVGLSAPTGLTVTNSPITSSGILALAFDTGYSLPTDSTQSTWDDAYTHSQIITGNPHALNNTDIGLGNVENTALSTYTGDGGALDNQYIVNGAGYITDYTETDPTFLASQAYNISAGDITNLGNLSGINTGDQDLSSFITASSAETLTNKGGLISQWDNDVGYLTEHIWDKSGDNISYSGGNVGIGLPDPIDLFQVFGNIVVGKNQSYNKIYTPYAGAAIQMGCSSDSFDRDLVLGKVANDGTFTAQVTIDNATGSATFTGSPIIPTRSTSDNSTYAASTAFVKAQGYITGVTETPVQVKTASFTAVGGVPYKITGSTAITVTTPTGTGDRISIVNASTATTTVGSLGDLAAGDSCVLYYSSGWKEYTNTLT